MATVAFANYSYGFFSGLTALPSPQALAYPKYMTNKDIPIKPGDYISFNNNHGNENNSDYKRYTESPVIKIIIHPYSTSHYEITFENGIIAELFINEVVRIPATPKVPVSLTSVVMSDAKREEIQAAISQAKNTELIFVTWGFSDVFEKGTAISLLFWGIPGTGKTLTAQAIADEMKSELKIYGTAEIGSSEHGGSERIIQKIFAEATRKNRGTTGKKRIILFDECDSLLTDRNEVGPILGAQVNQLLTEIEHYDGVIIFTTNRMGKLDPALERRISAKIEFEFPDRTQRLAIWKRMIPTKAPLSKNVNLKKLATYPLAGGNIKNAVLNAARRAAYEGATEITQKHFVDAIEREAASVAAFIGEYEEQTHQQMVGSRVRMGTGSRLEITPEMRTRAQSIIERGDNE